jgi:hypothetical protein
MNKKVKNRQMTEKIKRIATFKKHELRLIENLINF